MMTHGWSNYKKYAWGANELAPEVKRPHPSIFGGTRMGLTIVDSLDTLWIMGMFDEVEQGKQWLVQNLTAKMNVVCVGTWYSSIVNSFTTTFDYNRKLAVSDINNITIQQ